MILQQRLRDNEPIPQRIANAPELFVGLELFYLAFVELSSCRYIGNAEGPIPWVSIVEYCNEYEIFDREQRDDMFYFIATMDATYLKHRSKETDKKLNKGKGKGRGGKSVRKK
jgi:hypothetical protein